MANDLSGYNVQIDAALEELRTWRSASPPTDATSAQTYHVIVEGLQDAKQRKDADAFYESLASLNRFICDQAPLSPDFIPSFKSVFLQLHDERRQSI